MIKIRVKSGTVEGRIEGTATEIAIETAQALRSIAFDLSANKHDVSIDEAIDEIAHIAKIARMTSEEEAP